MGIYTHPTTASGYSFPYRLPCTTPPLPYLQTAEINSHGPQNAIRCATFPIPQLHWALLILGRTVAVRLGNSGLKVSKIILGCMSYGSPGWQNWVLPEEEGIKQIKFA